MLELVLEQHPNLMTHICNKKNTFPSSFALKKNCVCRGRLEKVSRFNEHDNHLCYQDSVGYS